MTPDPGVEGGLLDGVFAPAIDASGESTPLWKELSAAARRHASLLGVAAGFLGCSIVSAPWTGWRPEGAPLYLLQVVVALIAWPTLAIGARQAAHVWRAIRHGVAAPLPSQTARRWYRDAGGRERVVEVLVAGATLGLVLAGFTGWKVRIGTLVPFFADPVLYRGELLLHGGRTPASLLGGMLGIPSLIRTLDLIYFGVWAQGASLVPAAILWSAASLQRRRGALLFALTWIVLGVIVAYASASGGPAYYERLAGDGDPYAWLRAGLASMGRASPLVSQEVQQWLWAAYARHATGAGLGIAAMPSLHVAMATYFVLAMRPLGRAATAIAIVFLVVILVASVVLAPHYAIDGYASILGVLALNRLVTRWIPE